MSISTLVINNYVSLIIENKNPNFNEKNLFRLYITIVNNYPKEPILSDFQKCRFLNAGLTVSLVEYLDIQRTCFI